MGDPDGGTSEHVKYAQTQGARTPIGVSRIFVVAQTDARVLKYEVYSENVIAVFL